MSEWIVSTYCFFSENQKQLAAFHSKLNAFSRTIAPTFTMEKCGGFGTAWLGNVASNFKIDPDSIENRGYIEYIEPTCHFGRFTIDVESAWKPMNKIWDDILAEHFPAVKYVMTAHDEENNIYINTDADHKFFTDEWHVSYPYKNMTDTAYFASDKELIEFFNETKFRDEPFCNIDEIFEFVDKVRQTDGAQAIELDRFVKTYKSE